MNYLGKNSINAYYKNPLKGIQDAKRYTDPHQRSQAKEMVT